MHAWFKSAKNISRNTKDFAQDLYSCLRLSTLMNGEKAISVESGGSAMLLPRSISVLIVDGDSTCLVILSKMLRWFGYEVLTTKRAADAFCIIRERVDELDIILAETHLPDMDKYELLETVREMSKLPVIRK